MYRFITGLLVYFVLPFTLCAQQTRTVLNFNTHWAFQRGDITGAEQLTFNDKNWSGISIPHVMRIEKKHNGGNAVYQGIGWYRRYFKVPSSSRNKRITICFEGVQTTADVYLNGHKIATHTGGYMGFVVDISGYVNFEKDNVLAVRVSNKDNPQIPPGKPQSKLDFNYFGGIYRNVSMVVTEKVFISHPLEANKVAGGGVFITYPAVSSDAAAVAIKTNIVNATGKPVHTTLKTTLVDTSGMPVATAASEQHIPAQADADIRQSLTVSAPHLWHPDHPYLYHLVSVVYEDNAPVDSLITYTGIRNIAFAADGFYINGTKLYLRGANRHQAYEYTGDAATDNLQYRDAIQLRKGGFNAVRAAHYPASPAFLDACDKTGLLVIACEPGWQFFSKDSLFVANTYRDIREMIRRDRNHPSVFLWETSLNESPATAAWMQQAVQTAREEMPGNQLFVADDFNARSKDHYNVSYKVVNEDGSDPMPSRPFITREWGDTWMADAEKENSLRASRMYTEKGLINQCVLRQNALNGETSEALGGYWDHGGLDANPRIGGYFVWSYNDYTRGSDPITAFSGVTDLDRYEKFSYYQLQAMQDARNPAYGPMVYIGSYNNQPALDSAIMIFSNCDAVQLYRNNKFCGEITREQNARTAPFVAAKGGSPYFVFHTGKYEPGELKAIGMLDGKATCTHIVKTPGTPHHLEIEILADAGASVADGFSMTPFYVKVCDRNGTLVSNETAGQSYTVQISVSGQGTLIGGNIPAAGIALQKTEGGIAYGVIRHAATAGNIQINVKSAGMAPGSKVIKTTASPYEYVKDGAHRQWIHEDKKTMAAYYTDTVRVKQLQEIKLTGKAGFVQPADDGLRAVIDGNTATGWVSGAGSIPVSITLDLKNEYQLSGSRVVWGKDSDWYTYSIAVSANGSDWVSVKNTERVSGQNYQPVLFDHAAVRYVRYLITGIQPESSRIAVKEIQLYGKR
ncbi:glycoside hydrolase family 2 TIM barrel-domain containing protein [Chitinophaga ginsengisegetis]|uniref:glycoside hydrolase family 2 TIM barrel-domain containing protein n=1 Tax=Chitinophaga ginsengisegetis TaxID=393003 RepID=UPI000DC03ECF|nr:glycoside hydrolase family 2 TIM barrel-domain containing protein [Chitinophaga ginsengisegetis]MDR6571114.1 beta-galactosidase [Chitinophaga ginsengisegetis]MDR6650848.1 beta-galactosidase [Chitinophaga ginsengisegetis]MDR6657132.1 beta-galactosidase [Chitinophaga ginsengisegetis]